MRPFLLMVDSGSEEEPDVRRFASLTAALAAFEGLSDESKRFAWIIEQRDQGSIVHMRDGKRTNA